MEHFIYSDFHTSVEIFFGDPHVSFTIHVEKDGRTAALLIPLSELKKYLHQNYPREFEYVSVVRKGLVGYGPKEDKVLKILQEEGFPIEQFVIDYWNSRPAILEAELIRQARPFDLETHEKLLGLLEVMGEKMDIGNNISINGLSDELHELIANFCIKKFPQIIESEPNDIIEFNNLLIKHVPKLSESIVNFLDNLET